MPQHALRQWGKVCSSATRCRVMQARRTRTTSTARRRWSTRPMPTSAQAAVGGGQGDRLPDTPELHGELRAIWAVMRSGGPQATAWNAAQGSLAARTAHTDTTTSSVNPTSGLHGVTPRSAARRTTARSAAAAQPAIRRSRPPTRTVRWTATALTPGTARRWACRTSPTPAAGRTTPGPAPPPGPAATTAGATTGRTSGWRRRANYQDAKLSCAGCHRRFRQRLEHKRHAQGHCQDLVHAREGHDGLQVQGLPRPRGDDGELHLHLQRPRRPMPLR